MVLLTPLTVAHSTGTLKRGLAQDAGQDGSGRELQLLGSILHQVSKHLASSATIVLSDLGIRVHPACFLQL